MVGDEIWIYYTGVGGIHGLLYPPGFKDSPNGIGLAKLRLDGFVSVDAGPMEGTLTTKPFDVDGEQILINADASKRSGQVLVEILNAEQEPIAQFGKIDCDKFSDDNIRHLMSWQGDSTLSGLKGKTISLKFYLKEAKLFSFKVE